MNTIPSLSIASILLTRVVLAQDAPAAPAVPDLSAPTDEVVTCEYPQWPDREPFPSFSANFLTLEGDTEPNNTWQSARLIPLGFKDGFQADVDIQAKIDAPFDVDWLRFEAGEGDTIGVAVLAVDSNNVDTMVSVADETGHILLRNRYHSGITTNYPPESPLPAAKNTTDAALSYSFPKAGTYYLKINGEAASNGTYRAQIRLRHPALRERTLGTCQALFLDFDGVKAFKAREIFGVKALAETDLTPFGAFLGRWGIPASKEGELTKRISGEVRKIFDSLIEGTGCKIDITNSSEHPDTFGGAEVSRVIVGGTVAEFGISTIGLSQYVDPGNFSANDTAVVLLDALSEPATNPNSILSLQRASNFSVEDAVVHVVARVIVHEACHFLGCWHTDNGSDRASLADEGSNLSNLAGVGHDRRLGTGDDVVVAICDDCFAETEGVSAAPKLDREAVAAKVKAALAVGKKSRDAEEAAVKRVIAQLEEAKSRQEVVAVQGVEDTRKALQLPELDKGPKDPESGAQLEPAITPRIEQAIDQFKIRLESIGAQQE